jgi:hypothetical protein
MSTYEVTRHIRSVVNLGEACEIHGIRFQPVVPFQSEHGVLVSEGIQGDSFRQASDQFDRHLLPVVDALTMVTGAALSPLGGSTLIRKTRSKYIYVHAVRRRRAAHLTLYRKDLIDNSSRAADRLARHPQSRHGAHYLRQAALAENVLWSTFQTLQAAEALSAGNGRTTRQRLRSVMGDEAFVYFYQRDPILHDTRRNALAHGRLIEEAGLQSVTHPLQKRLLETIRADLGVASSPTTFSPVRGFVTFEPIAMFLEPLSEIADLPALAESVLNLELHSATDPRWIGGPVGRRLFRTW